MSCLGVFFALSETQERKLASLQNDEELMEFVAEVEEQWDESWLHQIDKAWDALHRSLTDGTLNAGNGDDPLDAAVLGGINLNKSEDYFVILKSPPQCTAIAQALFDVDKQRLRAGYEKIDSEDYDVLLSEEDFDYTWDWFDGLAQFYEKAALENRFVIFTFDQ